jgi:hypothetical protein
VAIDLGEQNIMYAIHEQDSVNSPMVMKYTVNEDRTNRTERGTLGDNRALLYEINKMADAVILKKFKEHMHGGPADIVLVFGDLQSTRPNRHTALGIKRLSQLFQNKGI